MLKFCSPYGRRRGFSVNPGSKAAQRGVREGDLITSINGESTAKLTNNEAHNLLKRSGSTLKLGLNEDIEGSPKKRQYRTIHHETHQETVKRSSVTYTLKETIERSSPRRQTSNEFEAFKTNEFINGQDNKQNGRDVTIVTNIPVSQKSTSSSSSASTPSTLVAEGRNISSDHAIASRQSSYSNCSSIPDEGSQRHNQSQEKREMNDGQERMSKSKKRRQRRKKLFNRTLSHESQSQSEAEMDELDQEDATDCPESECPEIILEPTSKNLEILRLKRIEHKYKVESPKELKIEKTSAKDKNKLAKSKSLDDDDLLKIQELSEASENEETSHPNVVISEASSEENLLDECDCDNTNKRSALDSMFLQLNDKNQIEATSRISPEEEQALRNFLGGLNLVNSPEDSAKDLYERTNGLNDSKAKKLEKRKQLEEYFIPIAQNPRYLDAISEEASDISDKECTGSLKSAHHIKQPTPEQDFRSTDSNSRSKSRETSIPKENPILVETKVVEPMLESICSTQLVPANEEKAEVVYLDDSSTASNCSEDFEEGNEEMQEEDNKDEAKYGIDEAVHILENRDGNFDIKPDLEPHDEDSKPAEISANNFEPDEEKLNLGENEKSYANKTEYIGNIVKSNKLHDLQVQSEESVSSVLSSHISTRISTASNSSITSSSDNDIISSQLTPPPTPDGSLIKTTKSVGPAVPQTLFDYTKIPNILKEKEPDIVSKRFRKESFENREYIASRKNVKTLVESSKKEIKVEGDVGNKEFTDTEEPQDTKTEKTEARSVSAIHMSKKTVNGQLDNAEFRKVRVDEVSKNGDTEVKKDFEEYTSKKNIDTKIELTDEEIGYKPDEFSKDANVSKKSDLVNGVNDLEDNIESMNDSKNVVSSNITKESKRDEFRSESSKESILRHVITTSQDSNKTDSQKLLEFESIKKLNSELKEKIEKRELIGPIFSKSKSPGNDFGAAKENIQDTVIMHCEEALPGKAFVQKRIKEFSQQNFNPHEETEPPTILEATVFHNGDGETSSKECHNLIQSRIKAFSDDLIEKSQCGGSVLKKIILADDRSNNKLENSHEIEKDIDKLDEKFQTKATEEIALQGSVLKRILECNTEEKGRENNTEEKEYTERNIPIIIEQKNHKEVLVPIKIEYSKKSTKKSDSSIETLIPIKLESQRNEKIIPIKVESGCQTNQNDFIPTPSDEREEENNSEQKIACLIEHKNQKEILIPIKMEEPKGNTQSSVSSMEQLIPIKLEGSKYEKIIPINVQNGLRSNQTERTIPIKIQTRIQTDKNENKLELKAKKHTLIPIATEGVCHQKQTNNINMTENGTSPDIKREQILPIKIDPKRSSQQNPSKKDCDFTKEDLKSINQSLRNIVEKKEKSSKENEGNEDKSIKDNNKIGTKNEPPIPPPRRSKALLLKKRNEAVKQNSGNTEDSKCLTESDNFVPKLESRDDIPVSNDMTYTNILSPPRPASASSDSSGSEESSRCTAKYNPNSSIADITSIKEEEEENTSYEPPSLRNIILKVLMSLPFGEEVLKELAEVSKTIEHFTNKLPFRGICTTNPDNILADRREKSMSGHWYTQSDLAKTSYEDEQRKIMELHQKFLTRRKYDEGTRNITEDDRISITGIGTRESEVTSPNRLLTIIQEEPSESEPPSEFIFYEDNSDQRLQAKNLGEWLTLARHKSKSTSNLDCTNIPINNLRRTITGTQNEQATFSNTRRLSLPQEIYEKQLIDIMEKEREIQRELEMLEEEKRKLRAELAPSKQKEFHVDDFFVSKKGDFAERREHASERRERPVSMPAFPTEFFRQQMYEEYMDKFSEREERKQQKVIKISSSNDLEQEKESHLRSKEIIHPIEIEQEFMNRVKEKLRKSNRETSEEFEVVEKRDVATPKDSSSDEAPVLVLDGDKVKGVETLPRHLQEFVDDLASQQDDSSSPTKIMTSQCDKKCCKEARRVYRVLAKNKTNKNYSLLHEIDSSLTLAKGFLLGKKVKKKFTGMNEAADIGGNASNAIETVPLK